MRILVIADPFVSVPPAGYGGTERIIDLMCRGLTERGHRISLLAGPGSRDYGGGVTVHHPPTQAYASRAFRKLWFQFILSRAAREADLVINHGRLDYLEILYRSRLPVVHWFHTPLTGREVDFVRQRRRVGDYFVALSRSQVSGQPDGSEFFIVPNAIDHTVVPFSPRAAEPPYVLFLGRLTRAKGVHTAIAAAQRAGFRLLIAGNLPESEGAPEYYRREIKPYLGPECVWVGPYDEAQRNRLLAGATALLFPVQAPEAFGLVMIEALSAGVPVIALRREATPEVVTDGVTGFLCNTAEEMARAISRAGTLSRAACRAAVEERFAVAGFINRVEELLTRVRAA